VPPSDDDSSSWSLQLIGDSSEAKALEEYRDLQKRFPVILGSRTPVVAKRKLGGRGSGFWYQVRLTEDSREKPSGLPGSTVSIHNATLVSSTAIGLRSTP